MRLLSLFLMLTFLVSCKKEKTSKTQDSSSQVDSLSIKSEDISKIKIRDIALDVRATSIIENWQPYLNISEAINGLKNVDFTFFNTDVDSFNSALKDLEQTIPESINTDAVKARILALKTMLYKLEDTLTLTKSTKEQRLVVIEEVFIAFSNLNLQINKKLEKDSQTIEKPY